MTEPVPGKTALTDPDNDPEFHFSTDDDTGGMPADEARAYLAQIIPPVGTSAQEVAGA